MTIEKKRKQSLRDKATDLLNILSDDPSLQKLIDGKTIDEIFEEIRLYHAELEIQNEELTAAYNKAEREKSHYQLLFHTSPLPIIVFNDKGVVEELNQAAMVALKTHYPTNRKKSIYQFMTHESGGNISARLTHTTANRKPEAFMIELRPPLSGQYESFLACLPKDEVSRFLLIMRDVTSINQLTLQNQLLSNAVSETTAGIVITGPERQVIWVNKAFTKMSGYQLNDVKGFSLKDFVQGPATDPETIVKLKSALDLQQSIDVEILNYHRNGKPYWNNLIITPIFEKDVLRYYVGIQNDITEKKELLQKQIQMQRWETIGQISAGISHDFNNILSIISGYEQLISSVNSQPELVPHLGKLKMGIERASSIISKLLKPSSISEIDGSKGELINAVVEVRQLVGELFKSSNEVNWDIDETIKQVVSFSELQDVLLNIIINAKNASDNKKKISVTICYRDVFNTEKHTVISPPFESKQYIAISISDNGCGIEKAKFHYIFEPFNSQSKVTGSGLGLSMVRSFVAKNQYGLTLFSQLGIGSTFTLWLPVVKQMKEKKQQLERSPNQLKVKLNIAVLDDEEDITEIIKAFLELDGHKVQTFHDSKEVINNIEHLVDHFDLLITDESMPGPVKGHDILTALKGRLPAILITGFTGLDELSSFSNFILAKPFTKQRLEQKIYDVIFRNTVV